MVELRVYAKLAIPTRANVLFNSSICFELSGPTAAGASESSIYPRIRALKNAITRPSRGKRDKNIWFLERNCGIVTTRQERDGRRTSKRQAATPLEEKHQGIRTENFDAETEVTQGSHVEEENLRNFILDWRESRRSSSSSSTIGSDRQNPHEKDTPTDHLRLQRPFDAETEGTRGSHVEEEIKRSDKIVCRAENENAFIST